MQIAYRIFQNASKFDRTMSGHLIDNLSGDRFSNDTAMSVHRANGKYLFGGEGVGEIDPNLTLNSATVPDNILVGVDAIQALPGKGGYAGEQWADMYANYMSGNIKSGEMYGFVINELYPPPSNLP